MTSRLLQEELEAGYCFKFEGALAEAKANWPVGLALGKLGVVRAPGRAERLVLDNSVAGTNSQCHVPEKTVFPEHSRCLALIPPSGKLHAPDGPLHRRETGAQALPNQKLRTGPPWIHLAG